MDRNARTALTVTFIVIGLLLGINYAVSENQDGRWLLLALFFFALVGLLWLWRKREDREDTELVATESLQDVERHMQEVEERVQDALDEEIKEPVKQPDTAAPAAVDPAVEVETASELPPAEEEELYTDPSVGFYDPSAETETVEVDPATEVAIEEETVITGDPVPGTEADMVADETGILDDIETLNEAEEAEAADEVQAVVEEPGTVIDTELSETTSAEGINESGAVAVASAEGEPDDLKRIEGIGPYYERMLNQAGVTTFAQLAQLSYEDILQLVVENQGGRKAASMTTWAEQAALAAKGEWDALEMLQDALTAGRRND
jgi:predicted flap endonuclease-1-like 5' DNA nuclease